jgi:hypothetical protein
MLKYQKRFFSASADHPLFVAEDMLLLAGQSIAWLLKLKSMNEVELKIK